MICACQHHNRCMTKIFVTKDKLSSNLFQFQTENRYRTDIEHQDDL